MAAYTDTHGFDRGSAAHPAKGVNRVGYVEVNLNFTTITADRVTAGATALAAGLDGDNQSHYFAAADTIDMLIGVSGAVTDSAVIKVWAVIVDCS